MELRHLRYFIAVAEELHFGRAARRLQIAQPPLSQQIRQLEAELGFALLRRTSRQVGLTDAGAAFLEGARRTLAEADAAVEAARRAARGATGRLTVGYVVAAVHSVLPAVLRHFRLHSPDVDLDLRQMSAAELFSSLYDGTADIGLAPAAAGGEGLCRESVSEEALVAALPAEHRLAGAVRMELSALAGGEPFVVLSPQLGPELYGLMMTACGHAGFMPGRTYEATQMEGVLGLVAGGMGVALVPASLSRTARPGVAFVPVTGAPLLRLEAVWRPGPVPAVLQRFLHSLRTADFM